ncbi:putative bacteriophage protein [Klebsiella pneumoniae]|nr:putative bacteriophage protein [Klebsiella pneumoniae]
MPMTFDQATVDGTGAFLVHELERLDQTLNLPLVNFTWSRDIQLREDVSIADEISSFTKHHFLLLPVRRMPTAKTGLASRDRDGWT